MRGVPPETIAAYARHLTIELARRVNREKLSQMRGSLQ